MERYVYRRRNDGIFVFNLAKTWEKLQLAARIIVAIENPQDIVAISARPYGQRAVLKFAHYSGAKATVGRHTPGAPPALLPPCPAPPCCGCRPLPCCCRAAACCMRSRRQAAAAFTGVARHVGMAAASSEKHASFSWAWQQQQQQQALVPAAADRDRAARGS